MDKNSLLRRMGWNRASAETDTSGQPISSQDSSGVSLPEIIPSSSKASSQTVVLESVDELLSRATRSLHESGRVHADVLHVSSLVSGGICPRMIWLSRRYSLIANERISPAMKIVWNMGRACEHTIRTLMIHGLGQERVIGKWSCACGNTSFTGKGREIRCAICNTPADIYGELDLSYPRLNIFGHPDFVYLDDRDMINVVEIKSINKNEWQTLAAPKRDHIGQVAAYHRIIKEQLGDNRVQPFAHIIYVCKDYIVRQAPWKTFLVHNSTLNDHANIIWESARILQPGYGERCPDRLLSCDSPQSTTCRNCIAAAVCFMHSSDDN